VSFGRRLALFFILIALVPTLALVGMLLIVSEDSRRGKADARLASGLETALAIYEGEVADAGEFAQGLSGDPELAAALTAPGGADQAALQEFATDAVDRDPDIEAVDVVSPDGTVLATANPTDAIAFAETLLTNDGADSGALRVSTTTADDFASQVRRLTKRELVVSRNGEALVATVNPPTGQLEPGETVDLETGEGEFRAHLLELDSKDGESLLLLGPAKEGGFLAIGGPAAALLVGFLLLGVIFAYGLARTLTGLHTQVAQQAVTDPLTGLWNRRRMLQMLEVELARARRFEHDISVLIVDIDNFKSINDTMGHLQGDAVLEEIAQVVRHTTRAIDVGARYGGDELALVLLETDAPGALVLAERLRSNIAGAAVSTRDGDTMNVTVSIGAATATEEEEDVKALIEAADQALLRAKRAGKDQVRTSSD
jgi:diguanylate cyclase (GGDEF)-like protein